MGRRRECADHAPGGVDVHRRTRIKQADGRHVGRLVRTTGCGQHEKKKWRRKQSERSVHEMVRSARTLLFALGTVSLTACGGAPSSSGLPAAAQASVRRAVSYWIPPAQSTFEIQYDGKLDLSIDADTYDLDGFDTSANTVATLHKAGRHVNCYIDVGTWESYRPDAKQFPKSVLGHKDGHWKGERWLDIRQLSILEPIMAARFQMCASKGFDAVDPDNIDGYENKTGFPINAQDQLAYDEWVAQEVHTLNIAVDQKNDNDQVKDLRPYFDFAVLEQCYQQNYCSEFTPYSDDNVLVVDIEYHGSKSDFINKACPKIEGYKETALLKHLNLNAWEVTCPD
jgi:hypothetical protein